MRTLEVLQQEVIGCVKCELHKTRTNTVFARGNPQALLCFVGEAPGEDEDKQALPFVGKSGQLLDKILTDMSIDVKKDIYICNVIKCRPPGNRRPNDEETNQCIDYLEEQLKLISAKVIVALGNTAVDNLISTPYGITKIRGQTFRRGKTLVIPTYHPSYLLRNNNPLSQIHCDFRADVDKAFSLAKESVAWTKLTLP